MNKRTGWKREKKICVTETPWCRRVTIGGMTWARVDKAKIPIRIPHRAFGNYQRFDLARWNADSIDLAENQWAKVHEKVQITCQEGKGKTRLYMVDSNRETFWQKQCIRTNVNRWRKGHGTAMASRDLQARGSDIITREQGGENESGGV